MHPDEPDPPPMPKPPNLGQEAALVAGGILCLLLAVLVLVSVVPR
jgi:hypothetical protein